MFDRTEQMIAFMSARTGDEAQSRRDQRSKRRGQSTTSKGKMRLSRWF